MVTTVIQKHNSLHWHVQPGWTVEEFVYNLLVDFFVIDFFPFQFRNFEGSKFWNQFGCHIYQYCVKAACYTVMEPLVVFLLLCHYRVILTVLCNVYLYICCFSWIYPSESDSDQSFISPFKEITQCPVSCMWSTDADDSNRLCVQLKPSWWSSWMWQHSPEFWPMR